ncbi:hypothetical protein [uncultured Desulfobulbus sp.]|uniref:hypothetical protein n=1 Tax=uncultured Desulfobulbus sp. TaxID=239745 RepID=UPI0029C6CF45|nr:hypothetical protein [uncultured Desulfobulbus sp.]
MEAKIGTAIVDRKFDNTDFRNRLDFAKNVAWGFAAAEREGTPPTDTALDVLGFFLAELQEEFELIRTEKQEVSA